MFFEIYSLVILTACLAMLGTSTIMLWRKMRHSNNAAIGGNHPNEADRENNLDVLERRMGSRIDQLGGRFLDLQTALISSLTGRLAVDKDNAKEKLPDVQGEAADTSAPSGFDPSTRRTDYSTGAAEVVPRLAEEDLEKKLETILNNPEFTTNKWQDFSKPFDVCAKKLQHYLVDNGIPMPKIEPFPPLKDDNPRHWNFMVVQAHSWKAGGKRFLIPRNYDSYETLWHGHLFDVRGNIQKGENNINGLERCAILKNGQLSGYIDTDMVERKGVIAID